MKILYNFPDKSISFDCYNCPDICCHVSNSLLMNENQKNNVLTQNKLLSSFINEKEDVYSLSVGKQCWFLQENGCELHSKFGSEGKPLTCQVYPFKVWRLTTEVYIVDYIPCPNFRVVNDESGISYKDLNPTIIEYIKLTTPKINPFVHEVDVQDIYTHLEQHTTSLINPFHISNFLFDLLDENQKDTANKLLFLYPQFEINPVAITRLKYKAKFKDIFADTLVEIMLNSKMKNIQNMYLLTLKLFNKRLLAL